MPGPLQADPLLNPDYQDILREFNADGVEYLVVGAYAVAAHGFPRATGDLDIWINPTPVNARKAWGALERFGAPLEQLQIEELAEPGLIFQIGIAPRRIDILTDIDGVAFNDAWISRITVAIGDLQVNILGRTGLIKNKLAVGRPQDIADAETLAD